MQAAEDDVDKFLNAFVRRVLTDGHPLSFKTLQALWDEHTFAFIHYAQSWAKEASAGQIKKRSQFLQVLFNTLLLRLSFPSTVHTVILVRHAREPTPPPASPQTGSPPTAPASPAQPGAADASQRAAGTAQELPAARSADHADHAADEASPSGAPEGGEPSSAAAFDADHSAGNADRARNDCAEESGAVTHAADAGAQQNNRCDGHNRPPRWIVRKNSRARTAQGHGRTCAGDMSDGEEWEPDSEEEEDMGDGPVSVGDELAGGGSVHPFLHPVRRHKHLLAHGTQRSLPKVYAQDLTEARRGQNIDLHVSVILEAQVGAIYLLYCLYCTQPFPQPTRIYLSPFNLAAMHRMLKVMQRRQLDDGVDILKQLTADNAFVYGLVDVCKQHQLATILASGEPGCASNTSHSAHVTNRSTFLEEGMRRALLHLRQVAPPGNLRAEFGGYKGAVGKLFAGSHIDDSHSLLPEQLAQDFEDHYADAIHAIHGSLAGRSDDPGAKRKSRSKAAIAARCAVKPVPHEGSDFDAFELELEAELQDATNREAAPSKKKKGAPKGKVGLPATEDLTGLPPAARAVVMLREQKEQKRLNLKSTWMSLVDGSHQG